MNKNEQIIECMEMAPLDFIERYEAEIKAGAASSSVWREALMYMLKRHGASNVAGLRSAATYSGLASEIHPLENIILKKFIGFSRTGDANLGDMASVLSYCRLGRYHKLVGGQLDIFEDEYEGNEKRAVAIVANISKKPKEHIRKLLDKPSRSGNFASMIRNHGWQITSILWTTSNDSRKQRGPSVALKSLTSRTEDISEPTDPERRLTSEPPSQPSQNSKKNESQSGSTLF